MWWILADPLSFSIALVAVLVALVYYYGTRTYSYWKERGIPYIKPKYPFLGTTYEVVFSLKPTHEKQLEIYDHFKDKQFGGIFFFTKPMLFIKDPTLIETILIKDFTSFYNRGSGVDKKLDPLSAHLVNLEDMQWKSLRQKLTPTFSSGKLKGMYPQLMECVDELVKFINNQVDKCEPMEVREVMGKFTTDVIGSCAFGLNTNALKDPESEFRKLGRKIFEPRATTRLRFALRSQYPGLLRLIQWTRKAEQVHNLFLSVLKETMSYREKNNVTRNDFVQLLMDLQKQDMEKQKNGSLEEDHLIIDDYVVASNAFVFFVAGFETTASTLSYCLYELALHPDIQEEAYQHVVDVLNKHGGEITYDVVKEMTFIHQIFAETLRLHDPAIEIRRQVSKNYMVPGTNMLLPKGSSVVIPIYSIHHDAQYFPDPEKFKPERFVNTDNIKKGTYLPFGDGPRICIGKRFAKMEMELAMVKLLLNFKFTLNPKTKSPLVYDPHAFLLIPIGGIWVNLQKRI